jgi:hypothetical protein
VDGERRDKWEGIGIRDGDGFITHQIAFLPRAEVRCEGFGTSLWCAETVPNARRARAVIPRVCL